MSWPLDIRQYVGNLSKRIRRPLGEDGKWEREMIFLIVVLIGFVEEKCKYVPPSGNCSMEKEREKEMFTSLQESLRINECVLACAQSPNTTE